MLSNDHDIILIRVHGNAVLTGPDISGDPDPNARFKTKLLIHEVHNQEIMPDESHMTHQLATRNYKNSGAARVADLNNQPANAGTSASTQRRGPNT